MRPWQVIAGLSGFSAVLLGAVGAHLVTDSAAAALIEKAALYQLLHSIVLLIVALPAMASQPIRLTRPVFALGILLFCGSLYTKALWGWPATLAPAGGLLLMLGWLGLALAACINHKSDTLTVKK